MQIANDYDFNLKRETNENNLLAIIGSHIAFNTPEYIQNASQMLKIMKACDIKPDDFKNQYNKIILEALYNCLDKDIFTWALPHKELAKIIGYSPNDTETYWEDLMFSRGATWSIDIHNFQNKCRDFLLYLRNFEMATLCENYAHMFLENTSDPKQTREKLISDLSLVDIPTLTNSQLYLPDLFSEHIEQFFTEMPEDYLINLGFPKVDRMIQGIPKKSINCLLADTGHGKTTFASQIAVNVALNCPNSDIFYFSLEMSNMEIFNKFVTAYTKGVYNGIKLLKEGNSLLSDKDRTKYFERVAETASLPIVIIDNLEKNTPEFIINKIKIEIAKRNRPVSLIIIDHWHLISFNPTKGQTVTEVQNNALTEFNNLVKSIDSRFLILTQRDKAGRKEGNRPTMHDTKGSSGLSDIAQNYWVIHRTEKDTDGKIVENCTFHIDKARHGLTGKTDLKFDRGQVIFTN